MKRLTDYSDNGYAYIIDVGYKTCEEFCKCVVDGCKNCYIQQAFKKLATYEDLEEQGVLVRLPCKVGDTVWELCLCDDGNYRIFPMIVKTISEYGTLKQVKKDITIWNIYAESDYTYMYKSFADFGKTVFSTKEEAEKKLEELKKNEI